MRPPRRGGCFNCGDTSHRLAECPQPVDWIKAVKRRIEFWAERRALKDAAVTVLYELCREPDTSMPGGAADPSDAPDRDDADAGPLADASCAEQGGSEPRAAGDGGTQSDAASLYYAMTGRTDEVAAVPGNGGSGSAPGV